METIAELSNDRRNCALGFRPAKVGEAYSVSTGNPRRHLLVPAYRHIED